jgi:predicted transcriptional regulator
MPSTLDKIIKEKGISLYRLAKLTGIPYSTLHALKELPRKANGLLRSNAL